MGIFAQVAGGAGRGMVQNVEDRREDATNEANRNHRITLQRMRDAAGISEIDRRQEHAVSNYETTRTDARTDAETLAESNAEADRLKRSHEIEDRDIEDQHEITIEAMKQWQKSGESGRISTAGGDWDTKVVSKGEFIGDNPLPVDVDTLVVQQPGTPFSYVQHGNTMLPHNYTDDQKEKALAIADSGDPRLKAAIDELMQKAGTAEDDSAVFREGYGFLPAKYFEKLRRNSSDAKGFNEFRSKFQSSRGSTPDVAPVKIGGGNKEMLSQGAAAREETPIAPLPMPTASVAPQALPAPPSNVPPPVSATPAPAVTRGGAMRNMPSPAENPYKLRNPFYTEDGQ